MERGGQVDVIYTDFEKAFDRVDHAILLQKLQQLGIHGDLLRWVKSYLSNRSQAVRYSVNTYLDGCRKNNIPTLEERRILLDMGFLYDLMLGRVDCGSLVGSVTYRAPRRRTRHTPLLHVPPHATNYASNEPLTRAAATYNKLFSEIDMAAAEDESLRYENRIKELHLEKEAVNRECTEIRAQLALAEDKFDTTLAQLHETVRKLKELENESDSLRKELTDVRRQLSNCSAERDKYNSSCRELREHVKRAEAERRDTARALDDAFQKIAALEETRTSLELERTRLQNQLKESESGGEHITRELKTVDAQLKRERAALQQAQHDAKELQSRLQNECEERERCASDAGAARRHAAELEAMLGCARGELAAARQRAAELGDACSARDQSSGQEGIPRCVCLFVVSTRELVYPNGYRFFGRYDQPTATSACIF
ncbi:unnamed protein product [Plutella xylostella]|uniref:(diamondback moth) hypothetical protein n=1 Tax=Plutella xylostella TaxID=51655 RepID=A0A8S4EYD0_PLUXY|nr:unnamed protein product [Plutella xylostella]